MASDSPKKRSPLMQFVDAVAENTRFGQVFVDPFVDTEQDVRQRDNDNFLKQQRQFTLDSQDRQRKQWAEYDQQAGSRALAREAADLQNNEYIVTAPLRAEQRKLTRAQTRYAQSVADLNNELFATTAETSKVKAQTQLDVAKQNKRMAERARHLEVFESVAAESNNNVEMGINQMLGQVLGDTVPMNTLKSFTDQNVAAEEMRDMSVLLGLAKKVSASEYPIEELNRFARENGMEIDMSGDVPMVKNTITGNMFKATPESVDIVMEGLKKRAAQEYAARAQINMIKNTSAEPMVTPFVNAASSVYGSAADAAKKYQEIVKSATPGQLNIHKVVSNFDMFKSYPGGAQQFMKDRPDVVQDIQSTLFQMGMDLDVDDTWAPFVLSGGGVRYGGDGSVTAVSKTRRSLEEVVEVMRAKDEVGRSLREAAGIFDGMEKLLGSIDKDAQYYFMTLPDSATKDEYMQVLVLANAALQLGDTHESVASKWEGWLEDMVGMSVDSLGLAAAYPWQGKLESEIAAEKTKKHGGERSIESRVAGMLMSTPGALKNMYESVKGIPAELLQVGKEESLVRQLQLLETLNGVPPRGLQRFATDIARDKASKEFEERKRRKNVEVRPGAEEYFQN